MNTRIQVEHRVTEEVVGCDLVWWQIQCARGEPLDWIQDDVDLSDTHAIEVRLYAEDPAQDWLPATGTVHRFWWDDFHDDYVMVDSGISSGHHGPVQVEVTPHFDPLLAKLTARGPSRDAAVGRLVRCLTELELHGVTTNRDYLLAVLQHPDFLEGNTTTLFVADHPGLLDAGPDPDTVALHLLATCLADAEARRPGPALAVRRRRAGATWAGPTRARAFEHRGQTHEVTYRIDGDRFEAEVGGVAMAGRVVARDRHELLVEADGAARCYWVRTHGDVTYVNSSLGQTELVAQDRFAPPDVLALDGGPVAPVPGRVVAIEVAPGDAVAPSQTLVVLESMKVEHHVRAPVGGTVLQVLVAVGDTVDAQQLLIRLEDPR